MVLNVELILRALCCLSKTESLRPYISGEISLRGLGDQNKKEKARLSFIFVIINLNDNFIFSAGHFRPRDWRSLSKSDWLAHVLVGMFLSNSIH